MPYTRFHIYDPKLERKRYNAHKETNQLRTFFGIMFYVVVVIVILYCLKK